MSSLGKNQSDVAFLFKNMQEEPTLDSDRLALDWFAKHGGSFSGFVNGQWIDVNDTYEVTEINDTFSKEKLCTVAVSSIDDILMAFTAANNSFNSWKFFNKNERSRLFYNIAKMIEEKKELLATVESICYGKHTHRTRTKDVPNLIQNLYQCADLVRLEYPEKDDFEAYGVVCVFAEQQSIPLVSVSSKICSILAAGNTAVLLIDANYIMAALLWAEIFTAAGLPQGVLNVLPSGLGKIPCLLPSNLCSRVVFIGSQDRHKQLLRHVSSYKVDAHIQRRPTVIVYEDADLSSAANGVLATLFLNVSTWDSGCNVLLQESIHERFNKLLEQRIANIRVGSNRSKTDLSCFVSDVQYNKLGQLILEAQDQGAKISYGPVTEVTHHKSWPPTLVIGAQTSSRIAHEEVGGPVVVVIPFRTVKESIKMCNISKKALDVSIWCEKSSVVLEVSHKLNASAVWINSQNVDVSLLFETKQSLLAYCSPIIRDVDGNRSIYRKISENKTASEELLSEEETLEIDKSFGDPAFNKSAADVNKAVLSAVSAQSLWSSKTSYNRGLAFIKMANSLVQEMSNSALLISEKEVEVAVQRLLYWMAKARDCTGSIKDTETGGQILHRIEPVGVVAVVCSEEVPLLSFVSIVAPAIAMGNTIVILASKKLVALAMILRELFNASGFPPGVMNIVTGNDRHLFHHLCLHGDVDAVWKFSQDSTLDTDLCRSPNAKRAWQMDAGLDWFNLGDGMLKKFLHEATVTKTIYFPIGDIFCN